MIDITVSQTFRPSNETAAIAEQIKSNFAGAICDLLGSMLKRVRSLQKAAATSHESTDQFKKNGHISLGLQSSRQYGNYGSTPAKH